MKSTISRRTLLAGAIAAPAILTLTRGAQAATNLTLGHNAAPGNPRSIATERFAELVKERSGGNITVRVAGSEQLGNEQSLLTSLRTGAVSMTVNSQGSTSALVPEIAALGLPFLFEDSAAAFKVLEGPIGEELAAAFRQGPDGAARLVGQRHPPHHQQQAPDREAGGPKGLKIRTPPRPDDDRHLPGARRRRPSRSASASSTSRFSRAWSTARRTRSPTSRAPSSSR